MVLAVGVLLVGLATPVALRPSGRRGVYPRLIIAGQVAGLMLVWTGLLGIMLASVAPDTGFFEWCQALATAPLSTLDRGPMIVALALTAVVPVRALLHVVRSLTAGTDLRRRLRMSRRSPRVIEARWTRWHTRWACFAHAWWSIRRGSRSCRNISGGRSWRTRTGTRGACTG